MIEAQLKTVGFDSPDPKRADQLLAQLKIEVHNEHPLLPTIDTLEVFAVSKANDDILVRSRNSQAPVFCVHLTWADENDVLRNDSAFPSTYEFINLGEALTASKDQS